VKEMLKELERMTNGCYKIESERMGLGYKKTVSTVFNGIKKEISFAYLPEELDDAKVNISILHLQESIKQLLAHLREIRRQDKQAAQSPAKSGQEKGKAQEENDEAF